MECRLPALHFSFRRLSNFQYSLAPLRLSVPFFFHGET